jgi:NDP-sugar pyrophosphorylase family protein
MNVPIFIRCFWKDAPWLHYCIRSLKKYAQGFSEIVVTVPSRDHAIFEPMQKQHGFRLNEYDVRED